MTAVAVVGGGPAGLMAAEVAARAGASVTVFDRMPQVGRKLLLAGRGGLNLTHSEAFERFRPRYGAAAASLAPALEAFGPATLREWSAGLGQPTVVGSSGRVFPAGFKASPLLRAWLRRLTGAGVRLATRHRWLGWNPEGGLRFAGPDGVPFEVRPAATVLALGGASWPRLGSDGAWVPTLEGVGIEVSPLRPANCGFVADWSPRMAAHAGAPLTGIAVAFADRHARGEAVITATGLEGGAIYALAGPLRDAILADGPATVHLALRPLLEPAAIAARLRAQPAKVSLSSRLRKALNLSPAAIALIGEARHQLSGTAPIETLVNAVPVRLSAPAPLDEAISTAGGVRFAGLDGALQLRARPGTFLAGEMLDWEAPTGGYLLQACFATGAMAGAAAARHAGAQPPGASTGSLWSGAAPPAREGPRQRG